MSEPGSSPRTPIMDRERSQEFRLEAVDKEWALITELIKRELQENPEIRQALLNFVSTPVSETLPLECLTALSATSPRLERLLRRYERSLGAYLEIPPVPDEAIVPDITYAPEFSFDPSAEGIRPGLTEEERLLVSKRYRFARDMKMLMFGADLLQNGSVQFDERGDHMRPTGIHIGINTRNSEQVGDLLNPLEWERREQLKDRVYVATVNEHPYILKERKTARHTDTIVGGHKRNNPSQEEFYIARYFSGLGPQKENDVSVRWKNLLDMWIFLMNFSLRFLSMNKD